VRKTTSLLTLPAALALALAAPGAAFGAESYQIDLEPLNDSGASGMAMVTAEDNGDLTVVIEASGLVPGQPHAQHIHGGVDMTQDFMCPGPERDEDGDGIVSTVEGLPDYGDVFISLTTEGDTSKESGLAIDRFPVADDEGNVSYERTLGADELPGGTIEALENLHVVQHGIDVNGNGEYDADAGPSTLDPSLPLEATAPADCGMIMGSAVADMPEGGVATGVGGTSGPEALSLFALGGAALAGAGAITLYRRRLAGES
jgi:CHRD domain